MIFLLSLVHLSSISFAVQQPYDLKVALVSDEFEGANDCGNKSAVTTSWINKSCHVTKASCLLFDQLDGDTIKAIYFATFDEAHENLKKGKVFAVVHIHKSFTENCNRVLEDKRSIFKPKTNFGIDVYTDRTELILFWTIEKKLNSLVIPFFKSLFSTCNYSTHFLDTPILINFQKPIFGDFGWNHKHYVTPIMLVM